MGLKNYTTSVEAHQSIAEIQAMLCKSGAKAVMFEYDNGIVESIAFKMDTGHGLQSFFFKAHVDKCLKVLQSSKIAPRFKKREQAARVTWRIIRDLIHAQLAMVDIDNANIAQMMLGYAQTESGQTLYEKLEANPQKLLGAKDE